MECKYVNLKNNVYFSILKAWINNVKQVQTDQNEHELLTVSSFYFYVRNYAQLYDIFFCYSFVAWHHFSKKHKIKLWTLTPMTEKTSLGLETFDMKILENFLQA